MAGNKSEKNAPKNQEMQEITIEGELRTYGSKYLPIIVGNMYVARKNK